MNWKGIAQAASNDFHVTLQYDYIAITIYKNNNIALLRFSDDISKSKVVVESEKK